MFVAFLILAVLSALILVAGFVWMLVVRGETTRRSGPDVGAEIMGSGAGEDDGVQVTLLEKSVFKGAGVSVSREAGISYVEMKRLLGEGNWKAALPPLLAAVGLFGMIVFGVIALWIALDDKLIATLIAAPILYTMARIARDFLRA